MAVLSLLALSFAIPPLVASSDVGAVVRGTVWLDRNPDGRRGSFEPGVAAVWVGVLDAASRERIGFAYTNARGEYSIAIPAERRVDSIWVECVPAAGFFPTSSTVLHGSLRSGMLEHRDFGLDAFRRMTLVAGGIRSLSVGDAAESDWDGSQPRHPRGDRDLFAGTRSPSGGRVSVWFNRFLANPLFAMHRDDERDLADPILAIGVGRLTEGSVGVDVVAGTSCSAAGNFFVWRNQSDHNSAGHLRPQPSAAYRTADGGEVRAVIVTDVRGGTPADVVVGTWSPIPGRGSIEVWASGGTDGALLHRRQILATDSSMTLGEVTSMSLARLGDQPAVIAGTRTGNDTGQLIVFAPEAGSDAWSARWSRDYSGGSVTCVAWGDITGDGAIDLIAGIDTGAGSGRIELWRNESSDGAPSFVRAASSPTRGVPMSLAVEDLGGGSGPDIAMGYRLSRDGHAGGVAVYYCDAGTLPSAASDPAAGGPDGWGTALAIADFDAGWTARDIPFRHRSDLAVGLASGPTTGHLVVLVR